MQELAEELAKTRTEIVAIQEIRWLGTGLITKDPSTDGRITLNRTFAK
jgi:hypothetical protein